MLNNLCKLKNASTNALIYSISKAGTYLGVLRPNSNCVRGEGWFPTQHRAMLRYQQDVREFNPIQSYPEGASG